MTTQSDAPAQSRIPLKRDRILRAAVGLADEGGIESVSMRKVGQQLGVEAMSLYNHVANKDEILDGMIDIVVDEIEEAVGGFVVPKSQDGWKADLRQRILTTRKVMLQHPWAPGVLETRTTMSPHMLRYFDSMLGILRQGGFSYDLAHHAAHALGSRMLGFTQELFEPDDKEQADEDLEVMLTQMANQLPHIVGMMMEITHSDGGTLGWCDDQVEFEFGLDIILDGLEGLLAKA